MQITIAKLVKACCNNGFSIVLEDRDSSESWCFNGKTIALRHGEKYYKDHDLLHEIGHFIASSSDQREFPEFGLALGIADPLAWGLPSEGLRNNKGEIYFEFASQVQEGLIDSKEQDIQEHLAQKISIFFGSSLGFSTDLLAEKDSMGSWEDYEKMKRKTWYNESEVLNRFNNLFPILEKILHETTNP